MIIHIFMQNVLEPSFKKLYEKLQKIKRWFLKIKFFSYT